MDIKKIIKILVIICIILIVLLVILMILNKDTEEKTVIPNSIATQNNTASSVQNNIIINNISNEINNNQIENNIVGDNTVKENIVNNNPTSNNTINNNTNNSTTENIIDDTEILNNQAQSNEENVNKDIELTGVTPTKATRTAIINTIQNCIKKYLNYVEDSNENAVYAVLDSTYIQNNSVTQDNVLSNVPNYNQSDMSEINEIYQITGSTYSIYYVRYQLGNAYIFFIVNMDITTDSFSIMPISANRYNTLIVTPSEGISKSAVIRSNQYNKVTYSR